MHLKMLLTEIMWLDVGQPDKTGERFSGPVILPDEQRLQSHQGRSTGEAVWGTFGRARRSLARTAPTSQAAPDAIGEISGDRRALFA